MQLLERYLQAIGKYLPASRRDDIVEELRANLAAQYEDKEAELGRPLTLEEEEAILRQHGHPLLVAVRYFPQRHLIGPTVFPYYWFALRAVLAVATLLYVIVNGVVLAVQPATSRQILDAFLHIPALTLSVAVWVTVAFIALEFVWERMARKWDFCESWSPRTLPPLEPKQKNQPKHPIFDLFVSAGFAVYVLLVWEHPFLLIGPGVLYLKASLLELSPVVHTVYWAFVVMAFAQVIAKAVLLFVRPARRYNSYINVLLKSAGIAILMYLVRAREYVIAAPGQGNSAAQHVADALNSALAIGLKMALVVTVIVTLWEVGGWILESYGHSSRRGNGAPVALDRR